MFEFVDFLLSKVFASKKIDNNFINRALAKTIKDIKYHFPNITDEEIERRIKTNNNELAVFLFRVGNELHLSEKIELKNQVHWLLKELCSCEIYFNNEIEEGFYVVHGEGTIIGSRNKIGKGFKIHQGCTIGHKKNGLGNGNIIGDDVTLYSNSSIIGELNIGSNTIIGAHVLVTNHIKAGKIIVSKNTIIEKYLKL